MPTVRRIDGFRLLILFPPREHGPAHVHVVKGDGLCKIELARGRHAQRTVAIDGMKAVDVRRAERIVREHTDTLLIEWEKIHDD